MAGELDAAVARMQEKVGRMTTVGDSMMALMQFYADQVRQSIGNVTALNAVADSMESTANAWAAKVQENTPPPAPPTEPPTPPTESRRGVR